MGWVTFLWLRGCCEAALTAEREALASLGRRLSGGVSAALAEMSLWLHPSLVLLLVSKMPHSGALWTPQHLQPPGKDSVGGQEEDPQWKGSSEPHCPHHLFPSLFPAQRGSTAAFPCSPLSSGASSPSILLPSAQSWFLCAQQHPGSPAQAPHT